MVKKNDILFSIIIPTFNRAVMISNAIQSVVDQTFSNWEMIIVDDGSTDYTYEVVKNFKDHRIKYFKKDHEERSIARNFGIEKANGQYLSFLDDDDHYMPEFLEKFYYKIKNENYPVAIFMSEEIIETQDKQTIKEFDSALISNIIRLLWIYEPGIRPFVIHKNSFIHDKFHKDYNLGEDMHLIIRLALKYSVYLISEPLYIFTQHQNQGASVKFTKNIKANADNSLKCLKEIIADNPLIFKFIPQNEIYDKFNHIVYGFSSAAVKSFSFKLFFQLINQFNHKGSILRLLYYYLSLFSRLPHYFLKNLISV
jgi:glycosyltransferase involved in cell wall biosynthesis